MARLNVGVQEPCLEELAHVGVERVDACIAQPIDQHEKDHVFGQDLLDRRFIPTCITFFVYSLVLDFV